MCFIFGGGHTEYGSHDPSQHELTMVRFTGGAFGTFGDCDGFGDGAAAGCCGPKIRFLNSLRSRMVFGNGKLYCRRWYGSSNIAFPGDGDADFFFRGA